MIPLAKLIQFEADLEKPSPNWVHRKGGLIRGVVIHATADGGNEKGAEDWMQDPASDVSAHLHIRRSGKVVRLVRDRHNAWHAGRSSWTFPDGRRLDGLNDETLGWEFANRNDGREPYTEAQYATAARLGAHYVGLGVPLSAFIGHSHCSPGRKTDPGPLWDWERFRSDILVITDPLPLPNTTAIQLPPDALPAFFRSQTA